MSDMFNGCKALSSLPNIGKWNVKNVEDMGCIFNDCKKLNSKYIPNKFK